MLEYLGYGLFGVVMIACLLYIMNALEAGDPPPQSSPTKRNKEAIRAQ